MFSTKGRYALRLLEDLAENGNGAYIPLKDISDRQEVSLKYAERLMNILAKAGFVESQHGRGGGYRLCRAPVEYRVSDIMRAMGEVLAPVACLACGTDEAEGCHRAASCRTLPMWQKLDGIINDFFDGVTLADLARNHASQEASEYNRARV